MFVRLRKLVMRVVQRVGVVSECGGAYDVEGDFGHPVVDVDFLAIGWVRLGGNLVVENVYEAGGFDCERGCGR